MFVWNSYTKEIILKTGQLILTMYILPFLWLSMSSLHVSEEINMGVPVMNVNFYMMGRDSIGDDVTVSINDNIQYLNEEFEGQIIFVLNNLYMDSNGAYLPTLHEDYFLDAGAMLDEITEPIEQKGSINVYLFDTYVKENTDQALMGFTPILTAKQKMYADHSPLFDRILIAYAGLNSKTTLVHEMGHFLGLQHPWEMNTVNKQFMGFANRDIIDRNHMSYNADVDDFTDEQLERMQDFAKRFRSYLVTDYKIDEKFSATKKEYTAIQKDPYLNTDRLYHIR